MLAWWDAPKNRALRNTEFSAFRAYGKNNHHIRYIRSQESGIMKSFYWSSRPRLISMIFLVERKSIGVDFWTAIRKDNSNHCLINPSRLFCQKSSSASLTFDMDCKHFQWYCHSVTQFTKQRVRLQGYSVKLHFISSWSYFCLRKYAGGATCQKSN